MEVAPANPRMNIRDMSPASRGTLLPFFEKQRNINSVRYGVQLAIYKRLFELSNPGKKVIGLILIVINSQRIGQPNPVEFMEVPIDKYSRGVDEMLGLRARNILDHIVHDPNVHEKYGHIWDRLVELCNLPPENDQEGAAQKGTSARERAKEQKAARQNTQKENEEREARRQKREDEQDEKWLNGD